MMKYMFLKININIKYKVLKGQKVPKYFFIKKGNGRRPLLVQTYFKILSTNILRVLIKI